MGYKTGYTGAAIDAALAKAATLGDSNNGFVKLNSTLSNPVTLGALISPGNYTASYWLDGPDLGSDFAGPLNITVCQIDGTLYQIVQYLTDTYIRKADASNQYGEWTYDQSNTKVEITATAPTSPAKDTMWLDTTDASAPILKIYNGTTWVECIPSDMMKVSIYDPNGIKQDIYAYVDTAIKNANLSGVEFDFTSHINDTSIHVTAADKSNWNSKATASNVNSSIATLKTDLMSSVTEQASAFSGNTTTLTETINAYMSAVTTHTTNTTIHPTAAKQAEWDGKANGNHAHLNDGRVTIDASNITGTIPIERIDKSALERLEMCDTETERLALDINTIQNGDMVYCADTLSFYFVIDDSKLGTENAFKKFATGSVVFSWDNIEDKPTTLAGFGIVDAYTKTEVDAKIDALSSEVDAINTSMATYEDLAKADLSVMISNSQALSSADLGAVKENVDSIIEEAASLDLSLDRLEAATNKITSLI